MKASKVLNKIFLYVFILTGAFSCDTATKSVPVVSNGPLPILGDKEEVNGIMNYHSIPTFQFVDQSGDTITENTFKNKPYIVDYFFTSCPTICPKVKEQEILIHETFKDTDLGILSVSIDPKYDNVERLKWYAERLEIDKGNWHLVTGEKDFIYDIADSFFHIALEDEDAPGGFDHDGRLVLVDKDKHIRSFCNGLDEKDVQRFIGDIKNLMNEK